MCITLFLLSVETLVKHDKQNDGTKDIFYNEEAIVHSLHLTNRGIVQFDKY